jgi:hypothetical protein
MNKLLPVTAKPVEKKPLAKIAKTSAPLSSTVVRKENKQTMTDVGKYNYTNDPTSGASNMKEWQLQRALDDSQQELQDLRVQLQQTKDSQRETEVKLK